MARILRDGKLFTAFIAAIMRIIHRNGENKPIITLLAVSGEARFDTLTPSNPVKPPDYAAHPR
jgi:hypothetical protein